MNINKIIAKATKINITKKEIKELESKVLKLEADILEEDGGANGKYKADNVQVAITPPVIKKVLNTEGYDIIELEKYTDISYVETTEFNEEAFATEHPKLYKLFCTVRTEKNEVFNEEAFIEAHPEAPIVSKQAKKAVIRITIKDEKK